MKKGELLRLVDAYGDACFDCGEWQRDPDPAEPYDFVHKTQQAARKAVIKAVDNILLERDCLLAQRCMTIARLGGTVEGHPTSEINFLQRVDELRVIEQDNRKG